MSLAKFILRRILLAFPVLFGVVLITFILMKLSNFESWIVIRRLPNVWTWEQYQAEWIRLGFDDPLYIQFFRFVRDLFLGDWGKSYIFVSDSSVRDIIFERLPRTLEITILCYIISITIGIKLGIISGSNRNKRKDKSSRIITYTIMAIPPFIFAILFSMLAANENIKLLPAFGYKSPGMPEPPAITNARILDCILTGNWIILIDYLYHLLIPMTAMIIFQLSLIFRHSRSSIIEVLEEDYIRTARVKGCTEKMILKKHILKNALGPSINMIAYSFPKIFAGFIALEVAFQIPGIGELFYIALNRGDYAVVIPIIFVISILVFIINFIADILYAVLDPRIRLK